MAISTGEGSARLAPLLFPRCTFATRGLEAMLGCPRFDPEEVDFSGLRPWGEPVGAPGAMSCRWLGAQPSPRGQVNACVRRRAA